MNTASVKSIAVSDKRIARAASAWVWVSTTQSVVRAALILVFGIISTSMLEFPGGVLIRFIVMQIEIQHGARLCLH